MFKWVLGFLSVLFFLPNFILRDINTRYELPRNEKFVPALTRLNTVNKLSAYTDSLAAEKKILIHSPEYLLLAENVVSERFYHGFSHYSLEENWIAALGEKIIGYNLSCIVKPDDILNHANAACSQQAIVTISLLRKHNIDYRTLGFPHHFAIEARLHNYWYFLDANQEPVMTLEERMHRHWQGHNDNLKAFYNSDVYKNLDIGFGNKQDAVVSAVNNIPGRNVSIFHSLTHFFSHYLWVFTLLGFVISSSKETIKIPKFLRPGPKYNTRRLVPVS
ncbi:MAG: hypothetical protein ABIT96_09985 [Ferruginibacter sp.]